jgi:hypothetical protein
MGTHGPGKKRILRSFTLTKLALVDDPAQEGADIVLRKRNLEKAKFAVMTSSDEGHSHLVEEWSDAGPYAGTTSSATMPGEEHSHSHPTGRSRSTRAPGTRTPSTQRRCSRR